MSKVLKTRDGREVTLPTPEEDAAITAAALSDPDAQPLTDEEWEAARPTMRRGGRPLGSGTKELLSVRLDRDVIAAFRATGEGWQTRMNDALREHAQRHHWLDR